jgi:hypothetical protein
MGPGMMFKAAMDRRMSLVAFGIAQVATDIETLVHILRGDRVAHGFCHTYLGAVVVGTVTLVVARPAHALLSKFWHREGGLAWVIPPGPLPWVAAAWGAYLGTTSHVLLDSLMHADTHPFAPFYAGNPWLGALSTRGIYLLCVAMGVLGSAAWWLRKRREAGQPSAATR